MGLFSWLFGSKPKPVPHRQITVAPPEKRQAQPQPQDHDLPAIEEAISRLGYLKPEATATLMTLIGRLGHRSPTAIATAFRKEGEQISADEKRALGIRRNAFMSRNALSELTESGRSIPLLAHENTLRRAYFTAQRHAGFDAIKRANIKMVKYSGVFRDDCPACKRLDGRIVPVQEADLRIPDDCTRDGCAMGLGAVIDQTPPPRCPPHNRDD